MAQPVDIFSDLIGHTLVIRLLRSELARPSQAYLFLGPSSTGKGSTARRFAAGLLCSRDSECSRRVIELTHPDIVLVEPDGRRSITVDQARYIVSQASLAPLEGQRKVFLFEEGGMMNDEAANALLKTIEEPTPSTIFLIVAESESDLPETISSRCRRIVFGRVSEEEITKGLVAIGIERDQAEQAARLSSGRPGLARSLSTEPETAAFRDAWLSVPMRLSAHPGDAFVLADEMMTVLDPLLAGLRRQNQQEVKLLEAEGGRPKALKERHDRALKRVSLALYSSGLEILAMFYRDAAAAQFGAVIRHIDVPPKAFVSLHPVRAIRNADRVLETIDALRSNQRPQLALANLFSDLSSDV